MNKNLLIGIAATLMPAWMQAQSEKPKNVLFIAVDDLNDWVGFLKGHPNTRTPNMDRLAAMGMVFESAYCAAPVSNASRAALLSGFRTSTTGVYGNAEFMRESPVLKDAVTLPKYFRIMDTIRWRAARFFISRWGLGETHSRGTVRKI